MTFEIRINTGIAELKTLQVPLSLLKRKRLSLPFFVSSGVANLHRSLLVTPAISSAGVTWKYFLEKEKYYLVPIILRQTVLPMFLDHNEMKQRFLRGFQGFL